MDILKKFENCMLCPRKCGIDRFSDIGICGMNNTIVLAKASLHKWEEPCISFKNGAGTVFFSGCNLHCCFCQNNYISNENFGKQISVQKLADIFLSLQDKGADNIELVTPTHFIPNIIIALDKIKHKLSIPVIYNSGGYELSESINLLNGYIDVYLPDIKYMSSELSAKYSNAPDYFKYASRSVITMTSQVGAVKYNSEGGLIKGTLIRHLVMPGMRHDSIDILNWISNNLPTENILVSIMNQFTPFDFIPDEFSDIKRKVTKMEYNSVIKHAAMLGLNGYSQDSSSATSDYTPVFDLSGI